MSKINRPALSISRIQRYVKVRQFTLRWQLSSFAVDSRVQGKEDKIAVVVGTVTDDPRLLGAHIHRARDISRVRIAELKALKVCALKVTATARARILKAGGEILTFDQLALRSPTGCVALASILLPLRKTALSRCACVCLAYFSTGTVLLRGPKNAREVVKSFGAAGVPHSHAKCVAVACLEFIVACSFVLSVLALAACIIAQQAEGCFQGPKVRACSWQAKQQGLPRVKIVCLSRCTCSRNATIPTFLVANCYSAVILPATALRDAREALQTRKFCCCVQVGYPCDFSASFAAGRHRRRVIAWEAEFAAFHQLLNY